MCLRRVFPLEVRRLMALHQSRNPGAGAGALPPLPPEGQPERVPWQLGGKRGKAESDAMDGDYDEDDPPTGIPGRVLEPPRTWKEGWYLWSMGSLSAFWNHTHQMATTLENVDQNGKVKRPPRRQPARLVEIDHEFDNHTYVGSLGITARAHYSYREENLLIPIPPDTPPIIEPVKKFLKPSGLVLNLFYDSVVEGHQREFFGRVWEKAQTDEPWKLAYNSVKRFYGRWKQNARSGDDHEEKKRR